MDLGDKIVWICLHALVLLVPLVISNLNFIGIGGGLPLTFDQFDILKLFTMRTITIVGLGAWIVSLLVRGGRVRFTKVDWLILAFLAWVGLTTITSIHWPTALFGKYRRFEGLISFVNYAAVFFLTVQMIDRPARMRSLLRTLFFSGAIVSFYGVLQYLGIEPVGYGSLPFEANRSFATYGNPDLLGGFLMFSLPLSIALALSEKRTLWRTIYWIGSVMSAVVWITAFTRSAWVGGFVAVACLITAAVRQRVRLQTEDWVMAGVALGLAGLVIVRSMNAPSEVMNFFARIRSIFQFGEGSALTRFQIWGAAWDAIKDRPIFGFGADTFRLVFPQYKPAAYVAIAGYLSVADNVHNYPLQVASAIGIPGFLLLYGIFTWVLVLSFKTAFSSVEDRSGSRILYSGVWSAAIGYIVHLFFGLSVTGTSVLLWLLLGLLLAPDARSREVRAPSSAIGLGSSIVVGLVAAALLFGNVMYVAADRQYLMTRVGGLSPEDRVAAAERAVELNPYNDIYRAEVGLAWVDRAYAFLSVQDDEAAVQSALAMMQTAEQSFLETIEFVPAEYDNYVFLSNLYNTMAAYFDPAYYEKAAGIARSGIEVEEFGPAIRLEYARALLGLSNEDKAADELEFALELDPGFASGALLLAEIRENQGRPEEALELLRRTEAARPTQAGVAEAIAALEATLTTP
jgi:putative inorganic carbon (HCO3(-)) transporter